VGEAVAGCDLVVGAALVPGARAPVVLSTDQVAAMRPGSVVVDLAIDQGGCIETSRPTSHSDPVYEEHGVLHYCVTNVPGQYPRTATMALSAALAPRVAALLADPGAESLAGGLNTAGGRVAHPVVAAALGAAAGRRSDVAQVAR
jgi:alanine dehydrogenase